MEKIFHWGSRCYGTSIDNTGLIFFFRGIHTWTNAKMKEFKFILNAKKNSMIIFCQ